MDEIEFSWDEEKAASNLKKHGVAFEDAVHAVRDPGRVDRFDARFDYGEVRMQIIGMSAKGVLVVIVVEGIGKCRIVSARRAQRREEQAYYSHYRRSE